MRRALWLAAAAAFAIFPATGRCQQQDQSAKATDQSSDSQSSTSASQQAPAQQESLADAARRSREQKKDTPKQAKVFTNDNIPSRGGISAVGTAAPAPADNTGDDSVSGDAGKNAKSTGEKEWRSRFSKLRDKLQQDEAELALLQRELGVLDVQNYSDPMKALQQGLTRSDINDKTAKIEAKKAQIDADHKAISDAEDDLRKSGGDSGWAR